MLQTQAKNFAWVFVLWGKGGFMDKVARSLVKYLLGQWSVGVIRINMSFIRRSLRDIRRWEAGIRK